jgi:hypothetical protein
MRYKLPCLPVRPEEISMVNLLSTGVISSAAAHRWEGYTDFTMLRGEYKSIDASHHFPDYPMVYFLLVLSLWDQTL